MDETLKDQLRQLGTFFEELSKSLDTMTTNEAYTAITTWKPLDAAGKPTNMHPKLIKIMDETKELGKTNQSDAILYFTKNAITLQKEVYANLQQENQRLKREGDQLRQEQEMLRDRLKERKEELGKLLEGAAKNAVEKAKNTIATILSATNANSEYGIMVTQEEMNTITQAALKEKLGISLSNPVIGGEGNIVLKSEGAVPMHIPVQFQNKTVRIMGN